EVVSPVNTSGPMSTLEVPCDCLNAKNHAFTSRSGRMLGSEKSPRASQDYRKLLAEAVGEDNPSEKGPIQRGTSVHICISFDRYRCLLGNSGQLRCTDAPSG